MTSTAEASSSNAEKKKPITIITIGMAGAGKSTFVQQINSYLHSKQPPSPPYLLNLDPAVTSTPFEANIDIRDTVDYHKVMKECVSFSRRSVFALTNAQIQIQPRTQRRYLDRLEPLHDKVRPGARLRREKRQ